MSVHYYLLNLLQVYKGINDSIFLCHRLFVNVPITEEDNILIKNLFMVKGYNAREFPSKGGMQDLSTSCYWVVRLSSRQW